jgi:hypothetical protein
VPELPCWTQTITITTAMRQKSVCILLIAFEAWLWYSRMTMKMAVFWVVAPCSLVEVYQHFRGPCCLHHQGNDSDDDSLHFKTSTQLHTFTFPTPVHLQFNTSISSSPQKQQTSK